MLGRSVAIACFALGIAGTALAQETKKYAYDARGRLIKVTNVGGPADRAIAEYSYDKADNRVKVTEQVRRTVVVPLNGLTVIPVNP